MTANKEEIERIKQIIESVLEQDFHSKRLKPLSRLEHLKAQIFFKIDNPDYVRKSRATPKVLFST